MNTTELNKIDRYRHLLPDPAPQVVGQLIEEVRSMREAIREAHAALSQLAEAREELEDWRNAAKGAENPHPDEQHCTCVPLLHKLLKEAREAFVIATDQLVQAQMEIRRLRDIEP
jgi:hypothetical protein